jgi:RND family efflux transporter MFP subunit
MTRKKYILPLVLVFTTLSCNHDKKREELNNGIEVKTKTVEEIEIQEKIRSSGRLSSDKEIKLSFKTGGVIDDILVEEGQLVGRGTPIARLKLPEIEGAVRQAELAVQKAERDYKRIENLYRDTVATLEQKQDAKTALELAESKLSMAKFNMKYSIIRAPGKGKVLLHLAEENELVSPGMPVILFGSTTSNWMVTVQLADRDIVKVNEGDTAHVFLDAFPGTVFKARVYNTGSYANPLSGTFKTKIKLMSEPANILSGFFAKVIIYPAVENKYLAIPVDALIEGNKQSGFVYTVENNKPKKKRIDIHKLHDNKILVDKGLTVSDTVITEGQYYISPTDKIIINNH